MRAGWLLGAAAVVAAAALCYYCMMLLVWCRQKLGQDGDEEIKTYGELGRHAYGEIGHAAVDSLVLVSQGGCCVAYLLFIGENLSSIAGQSAYSKAFFIFLLLPFQVLLAWVRSLAGLAPFSIVADVANLLAMAVVIKDDLGSFSGFSQVRAFTDGAEVPFAIGVAIYCYEGFSMTLPLEASLKDRSKFPKVLGLAFFGITVVYVSFGIVGYLAFADKTKDIITLNLPNDWSTVAVKLGLCVGLFFTYPVMMQPVHEIFERRIGHSISFEKLLQPSTQMRAAVLRAIRAGIVLLTAVLAVKVPGFAAFISLVGSTVCAMLAFVLPAIFHLHIFGDELSYVARISDSLFILFGVLFALYGIYSSLPALKSSSPLAPDLTPVPLPLKSLDAQAGGAGAAGQPATARLSSRRPFQELTASQSPGALTPLRFSVKMATASLAAAGLPGGSLAAAQAPPSSPLADDSRPAQVQLPNGHRVSYLEKGAVRGEAARTLLVLHGLGSSRLANMPGVSDELLREFGVRMVAIDRPGYGRSDPDHGLTFHQFATDVEALAHGEALALGDRFWVLGYSAGGAYAWALARYLPGRVAGLALWAPVGCYQWQGISAAERRAMEAETGATGRQILWLGSKLPPPVLRLFVRLFTVRRAGEPWVKRAQTRLSAPDRAHLAAPDHAAMMLRDSLESLARGFHGAGLAKDLELLFRPWDFQPADIAAAFAGPVHVWQGTEDSLVSVRMQKWVRDRVPGLVTLHLLPGEGHLSWFCFNAAAHREVLATLFGMNVNVVADGTNGNGSGGLPSHTVPLTTETEGSGTSSNMEGPFATH
eukprot:SM000025S08346  [mRNA]  locus=s25:87422:93248:- [translate_table: standard]